MIKKWITKSYSKKLRSIVFSYFQASRTSSDGTKEGLFDVLECRNWVNIIALDRDENFILVKQYRHGIDDITLEGPAGVIDGEELPLETAKRELAEETGYVSSDWSYLGKVSANPAFQNNYCSVFLARNCDKKQEQNLDALEEIEIIVMSKEDVKRLVNDECIHHSLFIAALGLYQIKNSSF